MHGTDERSERSERIPHLICLSPPRGHVRGERFPAGFDLVGSVADVHGGVVVVDRCRSGALGFDDRGVVGAESERASVFDGIGMTAAEYLCVVIAGGSFLLLDLRLLVVRRR